MTDFTQRFSSRVDNYIRYRPRYPAGVAECLRTRCGLTSDSVVADIGSGTGLLSELFLQNGNTVFGVEPNREMREAAERLLGELHAFRSVAAAAEATTLPDDSVDFVTAGQAFHWFDRARAQAEFKRVLRPQGWIVLVWNERRDEGTPFARAYEALLRDFGTDYRQVDHRQIDANSVRSFLGAGFGQCTFENRQQFDFEGLKGRLLSSSYAPEAGQENHAPMMTQLQNIHAAHAVAGEVTVEYDTNVYFGHSR